MRDIHVNSLVSIIYFRHCYKSVSKKSNYKKVLACTFFSVRPHYTAENSIIVFILQIISFSSHCIREQLITMQVISSESINFREHVQLALLRPNITFPVVNSTIPTTINTFPIQLVQLLTVFYVQTGGINNKVNFNSIYCYEYYDSYLNKCIYTYKMYHQRTL